MALWLSSSFEAATVLLHPDSNTAISPFGIINLLNSICNVTVNRVTIFWFSKKKILGGGKKIQMFKQRKYTHKAFRLYKANGNMKQNQFVAERILKLNICSPYTKKKKKHGKICEGGIGVQGGFVGGVARNHMGSCARER